MNGCDHSLLLGPHQFVPPDFEEGLLVALQVGDGVVVLLQVLHLDRALLVDLVVPVKLHVLQHAVALDDQRRPAHDLHPLHLAVQLGQAGREGRREGHHWEHRQLSPARQLRLALLDLRSSLAQQLPIVHVDVRLATARSLPAQPLLYLSVG
jgi:hypothetical protein